MILLVSHDGPERNATTRILRQAGAAVLEAAEGVVRWLESSYRALAESGSDGIFGGSADGGFVDGNAAGCRMLGYPRHTVRRRSS
jgi:PAS domain-containing protein